MKLGPPEGIHYTVELLLGHSLCPYLVGCPLFRGISAMGELGTWRSVLCRVVVSFGGSTIILSVLCHAYLSTLDESASCLN